MPITYKDLTRKAEYIEKFTYFAEKHGLYNCVSVSAKVGPHLTDDLAYGSLRALVLKYPLLFSCLDGEHFEVAFRPVERIDFCDVYEVNRDVHQCFREEGANTRVLVNTSFRENHANKTALWKVVYYEKTGWVTFNSVHTITDGGSVVVYLKEFVEGLNHAQDAKATDILFSLEDDLPNLKYGISPGIFDCARYVPPLATRLHAAAMKYVSSWWPSAGHSAINRARFELFAAGTPPSSSNPDETYYTPYNFTKESSINFTAPIFIHIEPVLVGRLLQKCRENGVKLQSYIILAYVHTIHEMYPDAYVGKKLQVNVAASFRDRFPGMQSHRSYLGDTGRFEDGFYISLAGYCLEPGVKFTWDTVKKYHDILHKAVNSKQFVDQYYLLSEAATGEGMLGPILNSKDTLFLLPTNLGHIQVLEYDDPAKFQILDLLFALATGAIVGQHHMTAASTTKNGLTIGLNQGDENVRDWPEFMNQYRENLLRFAE